MPPDTGKHRRWELKAGIKYTAAFGSVFVVIVHRISPTAAAATTAAATTAERNRAARTAR